VKSFFHIADSFCLVIYSSFRVSDNRGIVFKAATYLPSSISNETYSTSRITIMHDCVAFLQLQHSQVPIPVGQFLSQVSYCIFSGFSYLVRFFQPRQTFFIFNTEQYSHVTKFCSNPFGCRPFWVHHESIRYHDLYYSELT
jgi:hypothetical protein